MVDELAIALQEIVDHLEYWEAKPKNLAHTALIAPRIARARVALENAKQHDCIPADDVLEAAQ